MLVVLILSSVWNLVYAVGIGLVLASLTFMKEISDLTFQRSKISPLINFKKLSDEMDIPHKLREEISVKEISGPLFFGSTSDFQAMSKQIPDTAYVVIMKMEEVTYMDQSGVFAMEDVLIDLCSNNKKVLLVGLLDQPKYMMEKLGIIPDLISKEQLFETKKDSLIWIKENINDTIK